MLIALIDADCIVYECGFSSDANAKKDELEEGHEPLPFCLKIVKNKIEEILKIVGTDQYELYLTGKDNFRFQYLPDYKANRDELHKPFWYKEIKEYLIEQWDAIVVDGMEADDMLGIRQTEAEENTCICTKDKDLDMIPGFHYNWSPKRYEQGVYFVEPTDGLRFFYTQCLTGDATDNIPGLFKTTGKRATAKLKAPIANMTDEKEMWEYIKQCYGEHDPLPIAQCLWILREEGKIFEGEFS